VSELARCVEPELSDATLLLAFEGWNDAGESASLATEYVAAQLGLAPLAEIDPDAYFDWTVQRPRVCMDEGGVRQLEWPSLGFRFGSVGEGRDLVVGTGPEPHLRWRAFCDLLVDYAQELSVKRVVLLGAYLAEVVYSRPVGVTGFATHPRWLSELGVSTSQYEGPTGIVGVLGERFREAGLDVLSLWAGLPHYIEATPNPRGALALVQKLVGCLELKLDLSPLHHQAADFEQKATELVNGNPELNEYVRQLKRREFAQ
jgi:predicted ATP-grasp superfamily ATP-dependent carboligase